MNNSIHHLHVDPNQRFLIGDSCKGFLQKNLSHPNPLNSESLENGSWWERSTEFGTQTKAEKTMSKLEASPNL